MQNNDIKHREARELTSYLGTLNRVERAKFIKWIAEECDVARPVVYSWCYMCARIPEHCKKIIEKCAGEQIFSSNIIVFSESDIFDDYDDETTAP